MRGGGAPPGKSGPDCVPKNLHGSAGKSRSLRTLELAGELTTRLKGSKRDQKGPKGPKKGPKGPKRAQRGKNCPKYCQNRTKTGQESQNFDIRRQEFFMLPLLNKVPQKKSPNLAPVGFQFSLKLMHARFENGPKLTSVKF